MKNSQDIQNSKATDYEDLTLFADESFDTEEIDLFEFAGEDESPLTQLKSIILSLDWEITDETLDELDREVAYLQQNLPQDQISGVYLQGLGKIGDYIYKKGAFAHQNAIKLLLTFYYDFEKIVLSEELSLESIQLLLKADIRKFKILQYQIAQSEKKLLDKSDELIGATSDVEGGNDITGNNPLKMLKAAILSLDWEVTDESLNLFSTYLDQLQEINTDNKIALALLQGLDSLGGYIKESGASAHPESFTLLHSFSEAFEQITGSSQDGLEQSQKKEIVGSCVNKLNALKHVIAKKKGYLTGSEYVDDGIDQMPQDGDTADKKNEFKLFEAGMAESTIKEATDSAAPDLESEPDDIQDGDDADKKNEFKLFEDGVTGSTIKEAADSAAPDLEFELDDIQDGDDADRKNEFKLFEDEKAESTIKEATDSAAPDLESELDDIFGSSVAPAMESGEEQYPDEIVPPDTVVPLDDDMADNFIPSEISGKRGLEPALSDADNDYAGHNEQQESLDTPIQNDIAAQVDNLFASEEKPPLAVNPPQGLTTSDEDEHPPTTQPSLPVEGDEENSFDITGELDEFFGTGEDDLLAVSEDTPPEEPPAKETVSIVPALTDSNEEHGFSLDDIAADKEPLADIEEKLSFFFDDNEPPVEEQEEKEQVSGSSADVNTEQTNEEQASYAEESVTPALADSNGVMGFSLDDIGTDGQPLDEIEEKLDIFFDDENDLPGEEAKEDNPLPPAPQSALPVPGFEKSDTAEDSPDKKEPVHQQGLLTTLGALLPGTIRAPADRSIKEALTLIDELRSSEKSPGKKVVLQLLGSTIDQLVHSAYLDTDATEQLVNNLFESLHKSQTRDEELPAITEQFTIWQQALLGKITASHSTMFFPSASPDTSAKEGESISLHQLRSIIKEELKQLKDELK